MELDIDFTHFDGELPFMLNRIVQSHWMLSLLQPVANPDAVVLGHPHPEYDALQES